MQKVPRGTTKIVFQMDSAGGHGGGRGSLEHSTIRELRSWVDGLSIGEKIVIAGSRRRFPELDFVAQPARSPDFNVLDLGAWHSLQVAAEKIDPGSLMWTEEICERVQKAWDTWATGTTIGKLFEVLGPISRAVVDLEGGNEYAMPHKDETQDPVG